MKKAYPSVEFILDEIRLARSSTKERPFSFLIVEGAKDERVYQRFVVSDRCFVIPAGGKEKAITVHDIVEKEGIPGVLTIVDANSTVLEGKQYSSPNLLLTDGHDLEAMILASPALDYFLAEFGSEDKIDIMQRAQGKDVRSMLLACGQPIGYLRWLSLREGWSLKFEDLNFAKFIDKDTLKLDEKQMIRYVMSNTMSCGNLQNLKLIDCEVYDKIQQLKSDSYDPWHICCGHDLVEVLALGMRKAIGSGKVTDPVLIETCLRLCYDPLLFAQTQLCTGIRLWERINRAFAILHAKFSFLD